ncbi:alpha/beta fold hydrolase [Nocardioides dongxiaopingii]|uniref:alpha/beta fold hydrolase n=1 Tax=Nocardioides sp. S-1144 TaxID=2582905 RepID=UPI001165A1AD|nr:alpha/beta hydrolase [Nocardioides sp. S-1144]QCW51641.2 alpha/beta fold hydrolase [Nocardioides sp. S-1144]
MGRPRPVVVLLHGVGLDHTVWDRVVPLLEPTHDVVTPDLPGHGSGPRVPDDVDLAGLADLTAASVPEGAHLVGFSLGALVAQHLAAHRPGLVSSLVSVSSVCRRTEAERDAVLARLESAGADHPGSVEASLERWYAGTDVGPDTVDRTRRVLLANDLAQYLACYRVFATGDAEVSPVLGRIAVPAVAVTGSDDPGSTPDMTHRLAAAVPGCRAEVVPGVRHMLPVQAPRALATIVNEIVGGRIHA